LNKYPEAIPIQLACSITIHSSQGLKLNTLSFYPTRVAINGFVYITLSRVNTGVKTIYSLYLLKELSKKNFYVENKVLDEMNGFTTYASWIVEYIQRLISSINTFSISTLNTCNMCIHSQNIVQDEYLMKYMVLWFQETHLNYPQKKNQLSKFNFNVAHFMHGVITCVEKLYK
jgi:hypothetical protein